MDPLITGPLRTEIENEIEDATTVFSYTHAQRLNCPKNHHITDSMAKEIFGPIEGDSCAKPGPCPKCRQPVTHYSDDPEFQNLIDLFNKILNLKKPQEGIQQPPKIEETKSQPPKPSEPFPSIEQKFDSDSDEELARKLQAEEDEAFARSFEENEYRKQQVEPAQPAYALGGVEESAEQIRNNLVSAWKNYIDELKHHDKRRPFIRLSRLLHVSRHSSGSEIISYLFERTDGFRLTKSNQLHVMYEIYKKCEAARYFPTNHELLERILTKTGYSPGQARQLTAEFFRELLL